MSTGMPKRHVISCECYYNEYHKPVPDPSCLALDAEVKDLKAQLRAARVALRRVEFGNASTQHKCVACAGWDMGPNGETPRRHTKECPVGKALKESGE